MDLLADVLHFAQLAAHASQGLDLVPKLADFSAETFDFGAAAERRAEEGDERARREAKKRDRKRGRKKGENQD